MYPKIRSVKPASKTVSLKKVLFFCISLMPRLNNVFITLRNLRVEQMMLQINSLFLAINSVEIRVFEKLIKRYLCLHS